MEAEPYDLDDAALRDRAVLAAQGHQPFDVLISGGSLVDVATSEIRKADIGLIGGLIASVHSSGGRADARQVIDARDRFVAPGFIDTHMHIESSMMTPRRYCEVVVPQGTTTVCWDPHEIGNVVGLAGVRWAIEASRGLPLRILVLAPSCVPSAPGLETAGAEFGGDEIAEMLSWPEIVGVAEVMSMRGVLDRSEPMRSVVGAGLSSGKLVCGHARELNGAALQGFAAAGIESDHEIVSGDDLLEKLRAGFTIELRGSHDYVLPGAVEALNRLPHLPQTLTICTDDIFPDDLVRVGGMADVLRRLVGYGMPPISAIRAATLNAAMRLGRRDLGMVAAGRRADIVILTDLETFRAERVFCSGQEVAANGKLATDDLATPAGDFGNTVAVEPLTEADFQVPMPKGRSARINSIFRPRFTEWRELEVGEEEGVLKLPAGKLLMAVIHRHGRRPSTPQIGVLDDWGKWRGALATTVSHDSHNLTVFGREPVDMMAAANALIAVGGGMAVAETGVVKAVLPLPVYGLLSDASAPEIAAAFQALKSAADRIAEWQPPYRTFKAVTGASLACNPGPHVTDMGLADGATGEIRQLIIG